MLLVVQQVYNNNSALVKFDDGKEAIVHGKGIGFGKRRGDKLNSHHVSQILYLGDAQLKNQVLNLLQDVPMDIVITVFKAIDCVKSDYQLDLLNYVYITLSDHIFQMAKKLAAGTYRASVAPDIRQQYPQAYAAANAALKLINQQLQLQLPETEVKNIALHFINAQGSEKTPAPAAELGSQVNAIVAHVFKQYGIQRNVTNHNYFDRLMIHLQYLVERVQHHQLDRQKINPQIERDLRHAYPQSFVIADQIAKTLEKELQIKLNENERLYFMIHIQRLI